MSEQDETRRLRSARSLGLTPNPNRFTGVHRELALEFERLHHRIAEIDKALFEGTALPVSTCEEHVRYMGHYHRGGNFAGLEESLPQVFETQNQALDHLNKELPQVERSWCTVMPVILITPKVGVDVEDLRNSFKHLFPDTNDRK